MSFEKKDESPFEQYLNLSGSSSNLNSPVVPNPQGGFFSQQGLYQQPPVQHLTRPVPGFKTDYNLQKASSKTDLSLESSSQVQSPPIPQIQIGRPQPHPQQQQPQQSLPQFQPQQQPVPHVSQEEVTMFLDELNSLNSPSNILNINQFGSDNGSPQYMNAPPMIISTPPQDEGNSSSNNLHTMMSNSSNYSSQSALYSQAQQHHPQPEMVNNINPNMAMKNPEYTDFLQPDFQGAAFQQQRPPVSPMSDLASSVSNSPFLEAFSPSAYDDELMSQNGAGANFLDYSMPMMNREGNDIDLLSAQMDLRLTEENLQATQSPVTISISAAPEDEGDRHKTPSLFSSNRSSRNNSPNHSRAGSSSSTQMKSGHFAQSLGHENSSDYISSPAVADDSDLLKPDDTHSQMRHGRQRRQSRSRSRSPSQERDRSLSANREKMLELASPNAPNKRTQKHPSIYACHLCEKRFTRPYNLKSHLRTHTDERPFVCTVCGKAFARQHDRKRHEDLHSGEKRFECRGVLRDGVTQWGCGKKFARTDALGRHFKTEAGKECIRPLVVENELEMRQRAKADGTELAVYDANSLPAQLYTQFPGLMPSQNNSGMSDLSDYE